MYDIEDVVMFVDVVYNSFSSPYQISGLRNWLNYKYTDCKRIFRDGTCRLIACDALTQLNAPGACSRYIY